MPDSIRAVLQEYDDIFPQDIPRGLPPVRKGHEFEIKLEDGIPHIHRPLYKMSPRELQEAKDQIQSMLEHGFIRPSDTPYGSPVLFVPKKDGSLQFCIDYRWLNKKTVKNRYSLPLNEELLDRLGNAKVFMKIGLGSRYWQMLVKPGVKLAPAYAALALCLLTFTALLVWTLCTRTHEPGSGDVKL